MKLKTAASHGRSVSTHQTSRDKVWRLRNGHGTQSPKKSVKTGVAPRIGPKSPPYCRETTMKGVIWRVIWRTVVSISSLTAKLRPKPSLTTGLGAARCCSPTPGRGASCCPPPGTGTHWRGTPPQRPSPAPAKPPVWPVGSRVPGRGTSGAAEMLRLRTALERAGLWRAHTRHLVISGEDIAIAAVLLGEVDERGLIGAPCRLLALRRTVLAGHAAGLALIDAEFSNNAINASAATRRA